MQTPITQWYAIKTRQDFKASEALAQRCEEVFFPTRETRLPSGARRQRAIIPHVLFIKATEQDALSLEKESRGEISEIPSFWIYRYEKKGAIQPINEQQIRLIKLLTAPDSTRCEIYTKAEFKKGQQVRVTGGPYEGYTGSVVRVKKNKHVVISIEGLCLILLPFIHPDLLTPINPE